MIHEVIPVGMLQCNCSILGDEATREALVVDPGDDVSRILTAVSLRGLKVTGIVVTHAHIDHIGGAHRLKLATGAPVWLNAADAPLYDQMELQAAWIGVPAPQCAEVDCDPRDGHTLRLGATEITVLHTPGHTPGSIALWLAAQNKLLAGDTLFRDSIGRTDLPGGDSRAILRSIRDKILTLPDEAEVIPGHGEQTTIGREREHNYFLQAL